MSLQGVVKPARTAWSRYTAIKEDIQSTRLRERVTIPQDTGTLEVCDLTWPAYIV